MPFIAVASEIAGNAENDMDELECDGSERSSWGFIGDCDGNALLEKRG